MMIPAVSRLKIALHHLLAQQIVLMLVLMDLVKVDCGIVVLLPLLALLIHLFAVQMVIAKYQLTFVQNHCPLIRVMPMPNQHVHMAGFVVVTLPAVVITVCVSP